MNTLTLSWRPIRFSDVVGQRHVVPILKAMVRENSMPPAIIFGGSRGTGKTSCARIMAAALNCEKLDDGDACGKCSSCKSVQAANSLSVLEIDAASNGGVDEVRRVREMCQYAHEGQWRVVLLDEAHSMSNEAFNALLKMLEEPPPFTVFVLLTTETDRILGTVASRSMQFEFRRISMADIVPRLTSIAVAEEIKASDELLIEIASRVQGGMRDAVMMLDQVHRAGVHDVAGYQELFGIRDVSVELFAAAVEGDLARGSQIIGEQYRRTGDVQSMITDLTLLVRDLLVLKGGGIPEQSAAKLESRAELVERVTNPALVRSIGVLWELKSRVRGFEQDHRASMEMAFVLIAEALKGREPAPQRQEVQVVKPPARVALTLHEVQERLLA